MEFFLNSSCFSMAYCLIGCTSPLHLLEYLHAAESFLTSKYSLVMWTIPAFIGPDRKLLRPKELLFDSAAGEMNLFRYLEFICLKFASVLFSSMPFLQVVFVMFSNHNPVFTFLGLFLACYRCFKLHLPSVGAPYSRWWRAHTSRPTVINFLHLISYFLFRNKYSIVFTILFAAKLDLCFSLRMGVTAFHSHR